MCYVRQDEQRLAATLMIAAKRYESIGQAMSCDQPLGQSARL